MNDQTKDPEAFKKRLEEIQSGPPEAILGMGMMTGMAGIPALQEPMRRVAEAQETAKRLKEEVERRFPGALQSPEQAVKAELQKAQEEVPAGAPEPPKDKPTLTLDRVTLLKFELLATKHQLIKSEEQNLLLLLQGIKKQARELQLQEANLITETLQAAGIDPVGKSIRLVDRTAGLCVVE